MNKETIKVLVDQMQEAKGVVLNLESEFRTTTFNVLQIPKLWSAEHDDMIEHLQYAVGSMNDEESSREWIIAEIRRLAKDLGTLSAFLDSPDADKYKSTSQRYHGLLRVYRHFGASFSEVDQAYMNGLADAYEAREGRHG